MLLENIIRHTQQTNSSQITNHQKPPIRFSYNSPSQTFPPPNPILKCIESFGAVPEPNTKTNVQLSRQPSLQIFSQIAQNMGENGSVKRKRRNKIFQRSGSSMLSNKRSRDRSIFSIQLKNKDKMNSAMHLSQPRKKSKKKGIFSAYNPKEVIGFALNVNDEDGNRHFPILKPAHPKSLVHYVDLGPHRKKKKLFQTKQPSQKTFASQINDKEWLQRLDSQKTSQIPKCESKMMDAPLMESIELNQDENQMFQKAMNTSIVNIHDLPEPGPRFFDRNQDQISEVSNRDPFVDIKYMGSTNFSQFKRPTLSVDVNPVITNTPTSPTLPPQTSITTHSLHPTNNLHVTQNYSKKEKQTKPIVKTPKMTQKMSINNNLIPYILIFLGVLLLIIQIIK